VLAVRQQEFVFDKNEEDTIGSFTWFEIIVLYQPKVFSEYGFICAVLKAAMNTAIYKSFLTKSVKIISTFKTATTVRGVHISSKRWGSS
jgi:hypothetical protein